MKRFALYNRWPIELAPLQIYCSALFFTPAQSIVRKLFIHERPSWILGGTNAHHDWSSLLQSLEGHSDSVISLAFSPDSTLLASGSSDKTVRLWYVGTGSALRVLCGHLSSVTSLAFSPDGKLLASGSSGSFDTTLRLWDAGLGEPLQILRGHSSDITSLTFPPNGKLLAWGSYDATVCLWHIDSGEILRTLKSYNRIKSVAFSPDSTLLASTSSYNADICLWDVGSGALLWSNRSHWPSVNSLVFLPDGTLLGSGSVKREVWVWNINLIKLLQPLRDHPGEMRFLTLAPEDGHSELITPFLVFSPDTTPLKPGSVDDILGDWNTRTEPPVWELEDRSTWINLVAFSLDGALLALDLDGKTVHVWDISSRAPLRILDGLSSQIHSMSFSPDGTILASGSNDKTIRLWDTGLGKPVRPLKGHSSDTTSPPLSQDGGHSRSVTSLAFSPNGMLLASGSDDRTVRIWDTGSKALLRTLWGQRGSISSLAFSPDGKLLASAAFDNTVWLWDAGSGRPFRSVQLRVTIKELSFSSSGQFLHINDGRLLVRSFELLSHHPSEWQIEWMSEKTCAFSLSGDWIEEDDEPIFWLPPEYRGTCIAVSNELIALGHSSGNVSFFELKQGPKIIGLGKL
jgi:WD40 repeat protein